jgi:hypothetical protein
MSFARMPPVVAAVGGSKTPIRYLILLLLLFAGPMSPLFAESVFLGGAQLGDTGFYVSDFQPFAADMVFKWQVSSPDEYFFVDTQGEEWTIQGQLGMQRFSPPYAPDGLTLRDMAITLEGETGNLIFDRLTLINSTWPGVDGYWPFIPITGVGTFHSISFTLGFQDVPPDRLGVTVESIVGASSYLPSSFFINCEAGSVIVVPEPSAYAMALAGLACGGYSIFRRRKRA